jgi:hypothetical protein
MKLAQALKVRAAKQSGEAVSEKQEQDAGLRLSPHWKRKPKNLQDVPDQSGVDARLAFRLFRACKPAAVA